MKFLNKIKNLTTIYKLNINLLNIILKIYL